MWESFIIPSKIVRPEIMNFSIRVQWTHGPKELVILPKKMLGRDICYQIPFHDIELEAKHRESIDNSEKRIFFRIDDRSHCHSRLAHAPQGCVSAIFPACRFRFTSWEYQGRREPIKCAEGSLDLLCPFGKSNVMCSMKLWTGMARALNRCINCTTHR